MARPALAPEHVSDLGGHSARLRCHIGPAVPERHDAGFRAGVIAANVLPAGIQRMRNVPIQFHSYSELEVVVVQVTGTPACPAHGLPFRAGQSMTAFDVANIVPFQYRVNAVFDVSKRTDQIGAPAQSGPGRQRTE